MRNFVSSQVFIQTSMAHFVSISDDRLAKRTVAGAPLEALFLALALAVAFDALSTAMVWDLVRALPH